MFAILTGRTESHRVHYTPLLTEEERKVARSDGGDRLTALSTSADRQPSLSDVAESHIATISENALKVRASDTLSNTQATVEKLYAEAERGDRNAHLQLGHLSLTKFGYLPYSEAVAKAHYESAAALGDKDAYAALGRMQHDNGYLSSAQSYFKLGDSLGHVSATFQLALMCFKYDGKLADREYQNLVYGAVYGHNMDAVAVLGHHHFYGSNGFKLDKRKAKALFELAARHGNPHGQHFLGLIYLNGSSGVAADRAMAIAYFRLAADQGLGRAQRHLTG